MTTKAKPLAVITGDVHFTVPTLEVATAAVRQMIFKAEELQVPLILNGDTLDAKAIIRGEVANRLISLLQPMDPAMVYINTGNHDLINEKSAESSLNFLRPYATVIDTPTWLSFADAHMIPYHSDPAALSTTLSTLKPGSRLIIHQGVQSADLGHYVQDKTSLPQDAFRDFRVIASHYHKRQDIKCGPIRKGSVGLFSYVGNPYSLSFGEANDGPKGYSVLMDDGSLEFVPTNLRKHVVLEIGLGGHPSKDMLPGLTYPESFGPPPDVSPEDPLWLKFTGPHGMLQNLKKSDISKKIGRSDFKLDKIYTDQPALESTAKPRTDAETLDAVIDASDDTVEAKAELKALWRELV